MVKSLDASRPKRKREGGRPDLVVAGRVPGLQQLLQGLHLAAVHAAGDVQPALLQRVACAVKLSSIYSEHFLNPLHSTEVMWGNECEL